MTGTWTSRSEEETAALGRRLAGELPADAVVELVGDLGAGKTFLVKSIAAALGADPRDVSSPSFAIVHEYPIPGAPPIIHIDGYRLSRDRHEWEEIGIPDLLRQPGLKFVEWPNDALSRVKGELIINIRISVGPDDERIFEIS